MKMILATHNRDKCKEMVLMFDELSINLLSLNDFPKIGEIVEDGKTLEENALIKARTSYKLTSLPSLADDTGLEVDALNGAPGIFSARYAGDHCNYIDNVKKLLKNMENIKEESRFATFRTVVAYVDGNMELTTDGIVKGVITKEMKGTEGFGYDSIFYVPNEQKTYAEMNIEHKNKISHRSKAILNMQKLLNAHLPNIFINNMEDIA